MKSMSSLIIFALIAGMLGGLMGSWVLKKINRPSDQERIAEFYRTETAVMVSPHHLRKQIAKGYLNAILVDVRSQEEYEREHVVGAVNIPAYKDANTSAYGDVERIVNSFRELGTEKEVIVYCYSIPCMTGRKIGKILADHGIYVKELGVGWNEWRYAWTSWNHEHEWADTKVEDYVASGPEPGEYKGLDTGEEACPVGGDLAC